MSAAERLAAENARALEAAIESACATIAPNWPMDRLIAVNPYWGWLERSFERADHTLARLADSRLWMSRSYYLDAWQRGEIEAHHLRRALRETQAPVDEATAVNALRRAAPRPEWAPLPLPSEVLDAARKANAPAWRDVITQQVSQFCATHFDADQADWHPEREASLYTGWLQSMRNDHSIALLMDAPEVRRRARELPTTARDAIRWALDRLGVETTAAAELLRAVLLRINGWAAWCAWLRWDARLRGTDDDSLVELLAIRLAWECLVDDGAGANDSTWARRYAAWQRAGSAETEPARPVRACWQRALELAYQQPLAGALAARQPADAETRPTLQAVFCIDVRSEVFRRALETAAPDAQTLGFAGFFGLPAQYTPLGTSATQPQLPGLLAPQVEITESCGSAERDSALARQRQRRLADRAIWLRFQRLPASAFTLVESLGLGYLLKILRRSLPTRSADAYPPAPHRGGLNRAGAQSLRPRLVTPDEDPSPRIDTAEQVLRAMSLTDGFARIVLLVGHGSRSANNPHAAALDCGACCGQTGEVNARALADLLNDPAIRGGLVERGVRVPSTTHFLPALHNTTTDEVLLYDTDRLPATHHDELASLRRQIAAAGERARAERAPALGLGHLAHRPRALARALRARSDDWCQTRPEWGLAGNAAFIVAPRQRTRGLDLGGRAFLHDYDWRRDRDGNVLELIMTAPMIVTHWISMQYYGSTVDNQRFGSGNKVLHNVVGGRLGILEGNSGDLRIGLPLQSLHDGRRWLHTPLRLSVFIEAPRRMIDTVIRDHELVRQLVDHRWLYLFRLEPGRVERYVDGHWWPEADGSRPPGQASR